MSIANQLELLGSVGLGLFCLWLVWSAVEVACDLARRRKK